MKKDKTIINTKRGIALDETKIMAGQISGEQVFIDTPFGLKLHDQGKRLAIILNEINDTLRDNGRFNFLDFRYFGEVAKYIHDSDRAKIQVEVNLLGIYGLVNYNR